jgi:hypothetical protein
MPYFTGNKLDWSGPEGCSCTLYAQNHEWVGCQQLFWWIYQDDTCWFTCHCASEFWQDIQGKNKLLASFYSQILKTIFCFQEISTFFYNMNWKLWGHADVKVLQLILVVVHREWLPVIIVYLASLFAVLVR